MGPVESRCPRRLIAATSPLRHPDPAIEGNYAARWRQKCLDQATAKARRKAELVQGATICLSCILDFTDGYKGNCFVVEIVKRHGRNRTYFRAPNGGPLSYPQSRQDRLSRRGCRGLIGWNAEREVLSDD